jgi:glucosamine-6-phosphate deaminase
MRVIILEHPQQVSERAADILCATVARKPNAVLGLATGSTPLDTYRLLVERHRQGTVSFRNVTTFNLDEYVGLPPEHPQSYHHFMRAHLFSQADFCLERCHVPSGTADDLRLEGERYERAIEAAGGIDLQLLGLGSDGHIAFNEPGSSLASRTRVKALSARTRLDNARFFGSEQEVPRLAMTMGVGSILATRNVLLLAIGSHKATAVHAMVEGPITARVPASALQLHPQATILLDRAAAERLVDAEYYQHVESHQAEMERGAS